MSRRSTLCYFSFPYDAIGIRGDEATHLENKDFKHRVRKAGLRLFWTGRNYDPRIVIGPRPRIVRFLKMETGDPEARAAEIYTATTHPERRR